MSPSEDAMSGDDLTIIHLSELHFHAEGTRHREHLDSYAEALNTLEHMKKYAPRPDFFVITGDLVLGEHNAEVGYPRVREFVEAMAAEYHVPVLLALGNGDANKPFRRMHVRFVDVTSERPTLRWQETTWHEMRAERLRQEQGRR